ncbi:hypothetical protein D3C81_1349560 [compost metagenome]
MLTEFPSGKIAVAIYFFPVLRISGMLPIPRVLVSNSMIGAWFSSPILIFDFIPKPAGLSTLTPVLLKILFTNSPLSGKIWILFC